ncbi:MAG TPA: tripartite tricarboxylate transporter substrate binding protein [Burkholderiales bacterium]|nr:tripartite tricarboxylate transporter substrate binding protein [Burkholderiales bacterium]
MAIRSLVPLATAATLLAAAPLAAQEAAKDYPSRPVRLIVPNAPGSSVDTLSRIVANKLGEVLGQQVVIDNRAGAGGIIGMEIAKNANPDGYTLISATTAASTIAIHLQKNKTFDPVKDYDYVLQFAETPNVLVVNPGLPIKTVKELVDYAKSGKSPFNMASAGAGSQSHLSGEFFKQSAGIQSLHVPYKGGGASVASVIAGESQWTLTPAPAVMSHVKAGRLRAIGHSLPKRSALLGDIPPIAETIPGFDYSGWQGFFMPKGTPRPIIEKMRVAVRKTMELAEVRTGLATQATEIVIREPEAFRKVVADSMAKHAKLVQAIGLTAN